MSCVLYLLHFLAWLSKLKIQELYLTFPPNMGGRGKEGGHGRGRGEKAVGSGDVQTNVKLLALVPSHRVLLLRSPLSEPDSFHLWNGNQP